LTSFDPNNYAHFTNTHKSSTAPFPTYRNMPAQRSPQLSSRSALTTGIAICLILFCTTCGCLSIPFGPDDGVYQPSTFEPTVRPTHIPAPSPTMVCVPPGNTPPVATPTVNATAVCTTPPV